MNPELQRNRERERERERERIFELRGVKFVSFQLNDELGGGCKFYDSVKNERFRIPNN